MNSDYLSEIEYRNQIIQKAHDKIKITPDERLWLLTHSLYNTLWDEPIFCYVIEKVKPNKWYNIKIKVESISYTNRILPIVVAPAAKGKIVSNLEIVDINGNLSTKKKITMLGFESINIYKEVDIEYYSSLGLLGIEYQCDYFDKNMNLHKRITSSNSFGCAIKRQVINDHKVQYSCKSPVDDSFDALVFSVEWNEKNDI